MDLEKKKSGYLGSGSGYLGSGIGPSFKASPCCLHRHKGQLSRELGRAGGTAVANGAVAAAGICMVVRCGCCDDDVILSLIFLSFFSMLSFSLA